MKEDENMSYYATCPNCGANLDPGEQCDCKKESALSAATDKAQSGMNNQYKQIITKQNKLCNYK